MTQSPSFIGSSLFLRDEQGHYLPATPEQILDIARHVVDLQVRGGMAFSSPDVVRSFLRTKLAGYEREVFVMLSLDTRQGQTRYPPRSFQCRVQLGGPGSSRVATPSLHGSWVSASPHGVSRTCGR